MGASHTSRVTETPGHFGSAGSPHVPERKSHVSLGVGGAVATNRQQPHVCTPRDRIMGLLSFWWCCCRGLAAAPCAHVKRQSHGHSGAPAECMHQNAESRCSGRVLRPPLVSSCPMCLCQEAESWVHSGVSLPQSYVCVLRAKVTVLRGKFCSCCGSVAAALCAHIKNQSQRHSGLGGMSGTAAVCLQEAHSCTMECAGPMPLWWVSRRGTHSSTHWSLWLGWLESWCP